MVRNRLLVAGTNGLDVACFPPPHQFFSPRDLTDNLSTVWYGAGPSRARGSIRLRHPPVRDRRRLFVPWFNAPPGTEQRLGVFYLLRPRAASEAPPRGPAIHPRRPVPRAARLRDLHEPLAHGDRHGRDEGEAEGRPATTPDFVRMFKEMGVNIVHLAEFHGDGHPSDPGPVRLAEMQAMFDECRRLSEDESALPARRGGERPPRPGRTRQAPPGTGSTSSPKPVYWTMKRATGQPFAEESAAYGRVYHVGDRRRHGTTARAGARPGLDVAPADQGLELDARHLPP